MSEHLDMDPFWIEQRAAHLAQKSSSADPTACGTCRSNVTDGKPVEHDRCAQRATLLQAPDHPDYEILAGFSLEENAKLPARFHIPVFDDCGVPNSWLCAVCQEEGVVTGWPCATAIKHGKEVFTPQHEAETAAQKQAERIAYLERKVDGLKALLGQEDAECAEAIAERDRALKLVAELEELTAQATQFRVEGEDGAVLVVRRSLSGTWAAIESEARGRRRAWTKRGWRIAAVLADSDVYCWPDARTAVAEARQALAAGKEAVS